MKVAIIGGGISGLTAAYRLSSAFGEAVDFELFEASPVLGGVISTLRYGDYLVEEGPDSFITTKPAALALCKELGLTGEIIPTNPQFRRAFVALNGKLSPIPEGFTLMVPTKLWSFLNSDLLSWKGKIRAATEMFRPSINTVEDESLKNFVVRRFGLELFEKIAQPLIGGIYTADAEKLSAAAAVPQFVDLERKYGSITRGLIAQEKIDLLSFVTGVNPDANAAATSSTGDGSGGGARYSIFVTLRSGLTTLVERLKSRIPADKVHLNSGVTKLERQTVDGATKERWAITFQDGQQIRADKIIACVSAQVLSKLLVADSATHATLSSFESASSIVLNMMFSRSRIRHSMDGFGFVVPDSESSSVLACSFSSVKFPGRAADGMVMLRVFLGGALRPQLMSESESEIVRLALDDLRKYIDIRGLPARVWMKKWWQSMPQYHIGHAGKVEQVRAALRETGLIWAGNAIDGVGLPDCVRSATEAANYCVSAAEAESESDKPAAVSTTSG